MAHLRPVTDRITERWHIAIAKEQPKLGPHFRTREVNESGLRLITLNALHSYIEDCRTYSGYPDANEIAESSSLPARK